MAAVLACGEGAVLSHRSAAAHWKLLDPKGGYADVSVPGTGGRRPRRGIRIHRRLSLPPTAVTRRDKIPITTPTRTIADLRGAVSPAQLRRAIRQAEVLGLPTGIAVAVPTRSELEDLFLELCRRHRLPPPEVNVRIDHLEVDFLWRRERLVVETDGYRFHRGPTAFETDHDRDLTLQSLGFHVVRLTYRQVSRDPHRIAALLHKELKLTIGGRGRGPL